MTHPQEREHLSVVSVDRQRLKAADHPVIRTRSLCKTYGAARGINELSVSVQEGEIFGLLGPNGAGKTTTIRLLLDLIRPTSGTVCLFGADPRSNPDLRRRIGYLPGDLRLYERMTGRKQLAYFAGLRSLEGLGQAEQLAERFDVDLDRPLKTLSKGNRQKVGIVQAFMHDPELLILDEPTSGLDPLVQQTFYALLDETRATGKTVLISCSKTPSRRSVHMRSRMSRRPWPNRPPRMRSRASRVCASWNAAISPSASRSRASPTVF